MNITKDRNFTYSRLIGVVRASRPLNVLMAGVMGLMSAALYGPEIGAFGVIAAIGAGSLVAGQMIFNDVQDFQLDARSKPWRPIANGSVDLSVAHRLSHGLTAASLGLFAFLGAVPLAVASSIGAMCYLYSGFVKREAAVVGNILSAVATAGLCFISARPGGDIAGPLVFFPTIFFSSLARELAKDVEDHDGDRWSRKRTLPMLVGIVTTIRLAKLLTAFQVMTSYFPLILGGEGWVYCIGITLVNCLVLHSLLNRSGGRELQRRLKLGMVSYLVVFAVSIATK